MADDDDLEVVRIEQHIALMSEAEFDALIARTRAPRIPEDQDDGNPGLRKMVRQLRNQIQAEQPVIHKQPDPPTKQRELEGGNPNPPPISPGQYNRDFIRRMTTDIAAYEPRLPED